MLKYQFTFLLLFVLCPELSPQGDEKVKKPKTTHPLDPLTRKEIEDAAFFLAEHHGNPRNLVMPLLTLDEPTKKELAQHRQGKSIARRARAVVLDTAKSLTIEAVIDLSKGKVQIWRPLPGLKSVMTPAEGDAAELIVNADPRWQKALKDRGITNLNEVYLATWASDGSMSGRNEKKRLFRVLAYHRGKKGNAYGTPIAGLVATVDLTSGKVVHFLDTGKVPVPKVQSDFFDAKVRGPARAKVKPLETRMPKGASFTLHGNEIRWQKWRVRYTMHPREGLVLHTVGYEDKGKTRSILHRASLSEMVVPYGDPDPTWNWRSPFDQGEYGLGFSSNRLKKGVDVPEHAMLLDALFADQNGEPYVQRECLAIYERDGGLLFKHFEDTTGEVIARRARDLVLSWITTLGNYEYGFHWVFRQDGEIQIKVEMTGVALTRVVQSSKCRLCQEIQKRSTIKKQITLTPTDDQKFGSLLDKNVVGVNHQHIFNFRLDFDIDGEKNSFVEMNVKPFTGKGNPRGNAFYQEETLFALEKEAQRSIDPTQSRRWKVINPNVQSAQGHHPSYAILFQDNVSALVGKESMVRKRGGFMDHHIWTTRWKSQELHAAGTYPRQNPLREGLPRYSGDESIVNQDLVTWCTLSTTHIPRPEDWPLMPTTAVGFQLRPLAFFERNPALDVP